MNCTFSGNTAIGPSGRGGGMFIENGGAWLINCSLSGNSANWEGGGLFNGGRSSTELANCILWANEDTRADIESAQLAGWGWNNVNHSCVQGWTGLWGTGNIDRDPLFVRSPESGGDGWGDDPDTPGIDEGTNDDYGDLRLRLCSPAIDAGDNTVVPADNSDLDGDSDTVEATPVDQDGMPPIRK